MINYTFEDLIEELTDRPFLDKSLFLDPGYKKRYLDFYRRLFESSSYFKELLAAAEKVDREKVLMEHHRKADNYALTNKETTPQPKTSKVKYCGECGSPLPGGDLKYCPFCGKRIIGI